MTGVLAKGAAALIGMALLVAPAAGEAPAAPKTVRYLTSTPKLTQELEVTPRGRKAIDFKLTIKGACAKTRTGVARLKDGDPEMDDDESGVMIPMDEYVYEHKKGCTLAIRIQMKSGKRARIDQFDCWPCTPLEDLMLRTD